ncbi:MAG: hypothetical protein RPS47_02280 [Colwellia sp.]
MNIKNIIITLVAIIVLVVAERSIAGYVIDYYGPRDATTASPFLCINGDKDNSVDIKACKQVEQVLIANGSSVEALEQSHFIVASKK